MSSEMKEKETAAAFTAKVLPKEMNCDVVIVATARWE